MIDCNCMIMDWLIILLICWFLTYHNHTFLDWLKLYNYWLINRNWIIIIDWFSVMYSYWLINCNCTIIIDWLSVMYNYWLIHYNHMIMNWWIKLHMIVIWLTIVIIIDLLSYDYLIIDLWIVWLLMLNLWYVNKSNLFD